MVFSLSESRAGVPVGKVDTVAGRWLLWVDGVGGYLLLPGDDWIIGGPSGSDSEICIQGDLSRREACIRRQGSDYVLQPLGTALLGGRRMSRPTLLRDGDFITLGSGATETRGAGHPASSSDVAMSRGVRMEFATPHPLSSSARLQIESRHHTRPRCDAMILLADTCILGPTRACHVVTTMTTQEVVLLRHEDKWFCRGGEEIWVDGELHHGRTSIEPGARVETAGICFTLEAVQS